MTTAGASGARRRKMWVLVKEIGLTDEERLALAEIVLRRDISSFKELNDDQVFRMLDVLEGWQLIDELLSQRPCRDESITPDSTG